jgi:hypothetical protein
VLKVAGCDYGDLERLVRQEGLEGALSILFRQGVYLTLDEFKGRRAVVRGSTTIDVNSAQLRNPGSVAHLLIYSSSSRGTPTAAWVDFASIREDAINTCLCWEALGGFGWRFAFWRLVGGAAVYGMLRHVVSGVMPVRWFCQVDTSGSGMQRRYVWAARIMHWGSRVTGVRLPRPEHVPLEDPLPIARWMARVLRSGGTPYLNTFASSAVRLCQAAGEAGLDLRGARFGLGGEPTTTARLAQIRTTGAEAWPIYAAAEIGVIGHGCWSPPPPKASTYFRTSTR